MGLFNIVDARDQDSPIEVLVSTLKMFDKTSEDHFGAAGRGFSATRSIEIYKDYLDYTANNSQFEVGEFIFHEILHILFGSHEQVVRALNIDHSPYPPIPPKTSIVLTQESWERQEKRRLGYDRIADEAMRNWIDKGCAN